MNGVLIAAAMIGGAVLLGSRRRSFSGADDEHEKRHVELFKRSKEFLKKAQEARTVDTAENYLRAAIEYLHRANQELEWFSGYPSPLRGKLVGDITKLEIELKKKRHYGFRGIYDN